MHAAVRIPADFGLIGHWCPIDSCVTCSACPATSRAGDMIWALLRRGSWSACSPASRRAASPSCSGSLLSRTQSTSRSRHWLRRARMPARRSSAGATSGSGCFSRARCTRLRRDALRRRLRARPRPRRGTQRLATVGAARRRAVRRGGPRPVLEVSGQPAGGGGPGDDRVAHLAVPGDGRRRPCRADPRSARHVERPVQRGRWTGARVHRSRR